MKAAELKAKSADELNQMLLDLRKEQFNLRFQATSGAVEDTSLFRKAKKDIARIKTFLNQIKKNDTSSGNKK